MAGKQSLKENDKINLILLILGTILFLIGYIEVRLRLNNQDLYYFIEFTGIAILIFATINLLWENEK